MTRDQLEQWYDLVRADRDCRVYFGSAGCCLERGHRERDGSEHVSASGSQPYEGLMFGEDTTDAERADMD
jgi:hypothetical protein